MILAAIAALGEEDRGLVEKLFFEYSSKVRAIAVRITGEPDSGDDLLNDTFLKVIKYVDKFRDAPPEERKRLLVIVTRSVCFNYLRKKKRLPPLSDEGGDPDLVAAEAADDILSLLVNRETVEKLVAEINALDPRVRDMIALKYFSGMKNAEIAELYGEKPSTVRSAICRATAKLKTRMEEYLDG